MKKKVIVVMPAYNAEKTVKMTYNEIPFDIVDEVILVDDASQDRTVDIAKTLDMHVIEHNVNMGYGANQKSCYAEALRRKADVVVMLHADYQYKPACMREMIQLILEDKADAVLGSRIFGGGTREGGMPIWKYYGNRLLNSIQNKIYGLNLSDYSTGYKAYTGELLQAISFHLNRNDFIFDEEMNSQIVIMGFRLAMIPIPTKYFEEASSVDFRTSVHYGVWTLITLAKHLLHKLKIKKSPLFEREINPKEDAK